MVTGRAQKVGCVPAFLAKWGQVRVEHYGGKGKTSMTAFTLDKSEPQIMTG